MSIKVYHPVSLAALKGCLKMFKDRLKEAQYQQKQAQTIWEDRYAPTLAPRCLGNPTTNRISDMVEHLQGLQFDVYRAEVYGRCVKALAQRVEDHKAGKEFNLCPIIHQLSSYMSTGAGRMDNKWQAGFLADAITDATYLLSSKDGS
jgi:hypothetical protein